MDVEVIAQPESPGLALTGIPRRLREYLAAKGLRPSWGNYSAESMSLALGVGAKPLRLSDLDDKELREELGESSIVVENDMLRRMDAVLLVEPVAKWETRQQQAEELRERMEGASAARDELTEAIERMVRATGVPLSTPVVSRANIKAARDSVRVSKLPTAGSPR